MRKGRKVSEPRICKIVPKSWLAKLKRDIDNYAETGFLENLELHQETLKKSLRRNKVQEAARKKDAVALKEAVRRLRKK